MDPTKTFDFKMLSENDTWSHQLLFLGGSIPAVSVKYCHKRNADSPFVVLSDYMNGYVCYKCVFVQANLK